MVEVSIRCKLVLCDDGSVLMSHIDSDNTDERKRFGFPSEPSDETARAVMAQLPRWVLGRFRVEVENAVSLHARVAPPPAPTDTPVVLPPVQQASDKGAKPFTPIELLRLAIKKRWAHPKHGELNTSRVAKLLKLSHSAVSKWVTGEHPLTAARAAQVAELLKDFNP